MEFLQGTLELMILKTLALGPRHGYGIARQLEDVLEAGVEQGSLYPALYRMERRGLIEAEWGQSELGRDAKFYSLTSAGRQELKRRTLEWRQHVAAMQRLLNLAPR